MAHSTVRSRAARLLPIAGALVAAVLIAGCGSNTTTSTPTTTTAATPPGTAAASPTVAQPASVTVRVEDMKFSPDAVTVQAGDTVTWKFSDKVPHAVQGIGDAAMGINSPIFTGGEWSHTFAVPGVYRYLCPLHPEMRGTVTVR
ncbi:copper-binding protein [Nocardia sp. 852002-20019_SCH5090214]|jgi:plastocyanin|uniref:Copper-binding protein n=1 Tax=Nocardia nova TaxID=37330 RepID=A0A2S5ZXC4_9NOCA|nr:MULTISPECIES: plastocyanin/azurin family copper-binding protein [Nocardia]OBF64573.1 copper-binding protein [Mycobacterium sp. 852002-51759_SCH5129042]MBF6272477.1 cupredoxin domain-containing protein [Nocardia nova]MBV7702643.1 cupredoxin domain-containing protein [Nocardia nova]OBA48548.1 copper-binding protein [Nocardia sp. 852002-51101_SCH5132738]OBA57028.1 copper-binding protein [Nocardia sp. 852002-20019_SCH5090214]